jgi:hypothetical protein
MSPQLPGGPPSSLPPSPWVLVDTTTIEQAAAALALLEAWLLSGEPAAATDCATALSRGQDDAVAVARWAGALAARLHTRIEEASAWS